MQIILDNKKNNTDAFYIEIGIRGEDFDKHKLG